MSTTLFNLIPEDVKTAFHLWRQLDSKRGPCFETGVAYGHLLRKIERAHLGPKATMEALWERMG